MGRYITGSISCKPPRTRDPHHHPNCSTTSVPRQCSHCDNDKALRGCDQTCSGASQSWPDSSSEIRPDTEYSSKTNTALVQAEVATPGTADSFLRSAHVTRTRRSHQITAVALYILQRHTFERYCLACAEKGTFPLNYEDWCEERGKSSPQFQYWTITLSLELSILTYVQSLRGKL